MVSWSVRTGGKSAWRLVFLLRWVCLGAWLNSRRQAKARVARERDNRKRSMMPDVQAEYHVRE